MNQSNLLTDLRDIDGITGSFVLSAQGVPSARDLPTVIGNDVLEMVGSRMHRLFEALGESGNVDGCTLRFDEHRLVARPAGKWLLCVLASEAVNSATLTMGMTLVARRLSSAELEPVDVTAVSNGVEDVPASSVAPNPPSIKTPSKMLYRGRPVA